MSHLPLHILVAGLLLLVAKRGQAQTRSICDIDTDVIYFENEQLEKLRNSFKLGGDCSPLVWKSEFDNIVQNQLRNGKPTVLSERDRKLLQNHELEIDEQKFPRDGGDIQFEESRPKNFHNSENNPNRQSTLGYERKRFQNHAETSNSQFESERKRQFQQRPDLFRPNRKEFKAQSEDLFNTEKQRLSQVQKRPRPNDQRRPENQDEFISPDSPRRPIHQEDFFRRNPGRPRNQERPESFRPRRPQNQDDSFTSESERRPEQTRPDFPDNQRVDSSRPNNQKNPDISRRRPNDIIQPDDQKRPQFNGNTNNLIIPDSQRIPPENSFGNPMFRTTTKTLRPESTTLPGPPTWATPASPCVRRCPNTPEYNPVCGTDRVTYRNPGLLHCEQRCGKAHVVINHYGNCGTTTTENPSTTSTTSTTTTTTRGFFSL